LQYDTTAYKILLAHQKCHTAQKQQQQQQQQISTTLCTTTTMKVSISISTFPILLLALAASHNTKQATAFAPIHPGSPSHPTTTTSAPNRVTSPSVVTTAGQVSPTALYGTNFFDRFARVTKATINSVLGSLEDPEKVATQALEDMQNDLVRVRQTYAEVTATQRRQASSKRQLESQADDWYARAQLALKRSNEGLAREALARREALLSQAKTIQDQIDAQANNIDVLYEGMQTLEKKILEANSKKSQLAARARTAKSTQKINDMLSGLTGKTSMDAFNRMEEKVMALEAAAEVSTEMAKNTMYAAKLPSSRKNKDDSTSDIELQFRMLEASDSVDRELQKLKANMLPPSIKIPVKEQQQSSSVSERQRVSSKAYEKEFPF
jgi:phage shock protein A